MQFPAVNYLAVLVSGIVLFMLGGLWYSPVLFAKPWTALQGKTEDEMKASMAGGSMAVNYISVFLCGLITSWVLAALLNHFVMLTVTRAALVGVLCWLGFTGATSYGTAIFSMKPKALWLIDSGFYLVSFVVASIILSIWR